MGRVALQHSRDPGHWPIFECRDLRLMPVASYTVRLLLTDEAGEVAAERRVTMPHNFAYLLGNQVEASATAYDWRDWYIR
jgi:hypothetical protein